MKFGIFYEHPLPRPGSEGPDWRIELFASEVMGPFQEAEVERQRKKQEELMPLIAAALARKQKLKPFADEQIPTRDPAASA